MRELIESLSRTSEVEIGLRTEPPKQSLGEKVACTVADGVLTPWPRRVFSAPADLTEFRELVKAASFFGRSDDLPPAYNGWEISDTDAWLFGTANDLLSAGAQGGVPYFEKCFTFAHSLFSGPDYLAVDLHEDRYGWILLTWFEYSVEDAPYPIVAHSFTEWLERTVASGPDVRYWERKDFVDLGPAILGDPNYQVPNLRA